MTTQHLSWLVRINGFYRQNPGHSLLAVAALIASVALFVMHQYLLAFYAFLLIIHCLTLHRYKDERHLPVFVPDILAELQLQQDMLHVKHRQLPVSKIRKVALNQLDEKEAIIDFPFNVYRKLAMRFPASQVPALQQWLKQHLPAAEIIN